MTIDAQVKAQAYRSCTCWCMTVLPAIVLTSSGQPLYCYTKILSGVALIFAQRLAHLHCLDVAHMPGGLQGLPMCMLVHCWIFLSLLLV